MANLARFHRKKPPRKKDPEVLELDSHDRNILGILSTFIRLGESLDRSHAALVQHVRFSRGDKNSVILEVIARGDCQLEIWGVEAEKKAFEKIFAKELLLERIQTPG
jgi:exopolyphosphatase/guanosine-5'-triphosphate,3'-diphosphate pyrophosphatase